jgi:protein-S-isoprenylcysteine O-methyltransferase Ste14
LPPGGELSTFAAGPCMKSLWLALKNILYVIVALGVIAGWLPLRVFERRPLWPADWAWPQWAGVALILPGVLVFLQCVWVLAVRGQGTPAFFDPPKKLTKRGSYRWVRNPMYLALFALVAGEALFFRSGHIGVYFVCLVCALHLLVVLHEESALRFRHGAVYEDYKREVPRWMPRKPRPVLETVPPFNVRR